MAPTEKDFAISGSAVAITVPSSVSMKNAAATISAMRVGRKPEVSAEMAESKDGLIRSGRDWYPKAARLETPHRLMNAILQPASGRVQRAPLSWRAMALIAPQLASERTL